MCVGVAEGIRCVWGVGMIAVCVYRRQSFAVVSLEVTMTCSHTASMPHINVLTILKFLQEFLLAIHIYRMLKYDNYYHYYLKLFTITVIIIIIIIIPPCGTWDHVTSCIEHCTCVVYLDIYLRASCDCGKWPTLLFILTHYICMCRLIYGHKFT